MRVYFFRGLLVIIIAAMALGLYNMIIIRNTYVHEERVHNAVSVYAPPKRQYSFKDIQINNAGEPDANDEDIDTTNNSIIEAQRDINEDIAAWIRIPNTYIDYPVVHYNDNSFYLNHDVMRNKAVAGALFIDSRNKDGFVDFNTVIYGHNMKNGSMFGELNNFGNKIFFFSNPEGHLLLPDRTYILEIFAYLRIKYDDKYVYGSILGVNFDEFDEYVKTNAVNYKDIQLSNSDRIVTLSTCTNDYADNRIAVLARLNRIE